MNEALAVAIGTFLGNFLFFLTQGDPKKGSIMGTSAGLVVLLLFGIKHVCC